MKTKPGRLKRILLLIAAALGSQFLLPIDASAAPAKATGEKAAPPAVHVWPLASGGQVEGALLSYSMQSRILTLKLTDGRIAHVAPRDLTAVGKLKWLASPAFYDALQGHRLPDGAIYLVIESMAAPTLGAFLGVFLSFWIGNSLVTSDKRVLKAAITFFRCTLYVLVLLAALGFMLHAISVALGSSPLAPTIHGFVIIASLVATIVVISFRIGSDYGESGILGFGSVSASAATGLILATITLYLLPRFLERPGIDDWFTDRLLAPLGLV